MSLPANGITADVFRDIMPPYHLNQDLLAAMFTALPPPKPAATPTERHAHVTRLVQEVAILMPADEAQARLATQIVITREFADDTFTRSHIPDLTVEQVCRLRRTAAHLTQMSIALERTLVRRQQKPAPFFGTVLAEAVDTAALNQIWRNDPTQQPAPDPHPEDQEPPKTTQAGASAAVETPAAPGPAAPGPTAPGNVTPADRMPDQPTVIAPPASTRHVSKVTPIPSSPPRIAPQVRAPQHRSPDTAPGTERIAGPNGESVVTLLEKGPGWTLEVVRPRTAR